ncbi:Acyl-coenzyme A thioesterase THEM4 [Liparis tanakae]|uniref:Acyl-coenzyme A thioesterase THEM4 n=1 Tax=Liparis tanakae TaxID=230148 RepID=A0A4Z2ICQ6_9TELE|nr:Acyl-coenzyme A thioesterase THEM4 [Liparis tanakae]
MKLAVVFVGLSLAVMVVLIYQAMKQEYHLRNLKTRFVENTADFQRNEASIGELKTKFQIVNKALMTININIAELNERKKEFKTVAWNSSQLLQTCSKKKEAVEKKKAVTQEVILKLKVSPPSLSSSSSVSARTIFARAMMGLPSFLSKPRDFSLPNSSWGSEMMRLYQQYNSQCEMELEGGEKQEGPWKRLPSYNRFLKYAPGGVYLSQMIQSKARLFTRNIRNPGATFEYVLFFNSEEQKCAAIFQAGHLLEGPPGHVHGGAIATMIDTVVGAHATIVSGPVVTANLNVNYRRPIPLGSTLVIESSLDKKEGKKHCSCRSISATYSWDRDANTPDDHPDYHLHKHCQKPEATQCVGDIRDTFIS